jgi:hypothetical protein
VDGIVAGDGMAGPVSGGSALRLQSESRSRQRPIATSDIEDQFARGLTAEEKREANATISFI